METEAIVVAVLLLVGAVLCVHQPVRTAVFGVTCERAAPTHHGAGDIPLAEGLEIASAVECPQGSQDGQPMTVTGIAVDYTPPVVQAVVDDDEL